MDLQASLQHDPSRYDFFAAARRLECVYRDRPRIGCSVKATEDFVRLCQTPSLKFAPRMIERYVPGAPGEPAKLYGLFFGLFGPHGPLPTHLTEYAIDRIRHERDHTFSAFADIFHHRMTGLFYRAWADAEPTVQFDRPAEDHFRRYLGAFVGLASGDLEDRDALPDSYKRFFAGRLVSHSRSREGLKGMIERFFRVTVDVLEFVGEWMRLPATAHMSLGGSSELASLGRTAVIGEYAWGCQQRFRLRIGPLSRSEFEKFLPGGESLRQLVSTVRNYVGDEKAWDVQLVLKKEQVPAMTLGRSGRLGLTGWMAPPQPAIDDLDDVILRPVG